VWGRCRAHCSSRASPRPIELLSSYRLLSRLSGDPTLEERHAGSDAPCRCADVAPGDACRELVKGSATPNAVKIGLYSGAQHAFEGSELPAKVTYRFRTIGYDPQAS